MANSSAQLIALDSAKDQSRSPAFLHRFQSIKSAVVTIYAGEEIGSGSIVSPEGLVITNYHVIKSSIEAQFNERLSIETADGDRYFGKVIGTDAFNDLAIMRLQAERSFSPLRMTANDMLQIGQLVCAIGSPYGRPGVLTEGTLSQIKPNGDLQSSVVLKPGNSGGPLLNARGEMIGVNKAILQFASGKNSGISCATGIRAVRSLLESCRQKPIAYLPLKRSPIQAEVSTSVGAKPSCNASPLTISPVIVDFHASHRHNSLQHRDLIGLTVDSRNLIVRRVKPGSIAAISGFRIGDRLISLNGRSLNQLAELQFFLKQKPEVGIFAISRKQQYITLQVSF